MVKISKDSAQLSNSELDEIMLLLEASFAITGDKNIFKVIEILMTDTYKEQINDIHSRCTSLV